MRKFFYKYSLKSSCNGKSCCILNVFNFLQNDSLLCLLRCGLINILQNVKRAFHGRITKIIFFIYFHLLIFFRICSSKFSWLSIICPKYFWKEHVSTPDSEKSACLFSFLPRNNFLCLFVSVKVKIHFSLRMYHKQNILWKDLTLSWNLFAQIKLKSGSWRPGMLPGRLFFIQNYSLLSPMKIINHTIRRLSF